MSPTWTSVAVLGGIVLIRTFLSFSLDVEITGRWPWTKPDLPAAASTATGRALVHPLRPAPLRRLFSPEGTQAARQVTRQQRPAQLRAVSAALSRLIGSSRQARASTNLDHVPDRAAKPTEESTNDFHADRAGLGVTAIEHQASAPAPDQEPRFASV